MEVNSYTYINACDTIILLQILQLIPKPTCQPVVLLKCSLAFAKQAISISFLWRKYSRYASKLKLDKNTIVLAVALVKIMILEKNVKYIGLKLGYM